VSELFDLSTGKGGAFLAVLLFIVGLPITFAFNHYYKERGSLPRWIKWTTGVFVVVIAGTFGRASFTPQKRTPLMQAQGAPSLPPTQPPARSPEPQPRPSAYVAPIPDPTVAAVTFAPEPAATPAPVSEAHEAGGPSGRHRPMQSASPIISMTPPTLPPTTLPSTTLPPPPTTLPVRHVPTFFIQKPYIEPPPDRDGEMLSHGELLLEWYTDAKEGNLNLPRVFSHRFRESRSYPTNSPDPVAGVYVGSAATKDAISLSVNGRGELTAFHGKLRVGTRHGELPVAPALPQLDAPRFNSGVLAAYVPNQHDPKRAPGHVLFVLRTTKQRAIIGYLLLRAERGEQLALVEVDTEWRGR
jgi:hypothetical protein